jgi:hypothetical protein
MPPTWQPFASSGRLLDDRIEISARPLQFFDLLEPVQPHFTTAVPHHLPVLKQFRQFIVIEGRHRGLRNGFAPHRLGGTVIAAQLLFDGLPQVLYQVETVGHLPCLAAPCLAAWGLGLPFAIMCR